MQLAGGVADVAARSQPHAAPPVTARACPALALSDSLEAEAVS